nr:benzoate/H(+) symporter BenE family transporter [Millisia brevis]
MSTPASPPPAPEPAPPHPAGTDQTARAIIAGIVTAVVGFTSSFAVVLTGLRAVGADTAQAGSGLMVLCLATGFGCLFFSWRTRMPITMAWSTPGAALLAAAAIPAGGFAAAVGAFVLAGVLLALAALVRPLGRLVEAIPTPLANAMLAGVLLSLCVAPFTALAASPAAIAPVLVVWLLLMAFARRWAVPGAFGAAVVVMALSGVFGELTVDRLLPRFGLVTPTWDATTLVAIGIPLFVVTMTSQNIPGIAVLASFGYRPSTRGPLLYAGAATAVGAVGGGHAVNLAAISAALSAGPEAHPDPSRRWVAGVAAGVTYLVLGPSAAAVGAVADAAPHGLIESIAGVALIATFAGAASAALGTPAYREAAAITFVVAASGMAIAGIGSAFWALVAGGLWLAMMRLAAVRTARRADRPATAPNPPDAAESSRDDVGESTPAVEAPAVVEARSGVVETRPGDTAASGSAAPIDPASNTLDPTTR